MWKEKGFSHTSRKKKGLGSGGNGSKANSNNILYIPYKFIFFISLLVKACGGIMHSLSTPGLATLGVFVYLAYFYPG
jgi:hypothetical protein